MDCRAGGPNEVTKFLGKVTDPVYSARGVPYAFVRSFPSGRTAC